MTDLPDDIDQLKAMLLELHQQNEAKDKLLVAKQEEVAELKTRIELLVEQLNLSKSKRFSSQSEKTPKGTFNEAEQQKSTTTFDDQKKKRGRKPFPKELEREVLKHELNAPYCECCD
ncbi:hypothetical protein, partial [Vibrio breoganii]